MPLSKRTAHDQTLHRRDPLLTVGANETELEQALVLTEDARAEVTALAAEVARLRAENARLSAQLDIARADLAPQRVTPRRKDRNVAPNPEAEAMLRQSEARLRLATEGAGVGIWELDLATRRGRWSPEAVTLFGAGRAEFTAEDWIEAVHPGDRARAAEAWRRAVEEGAPYEIEYRAAAPAPDEGGARWLLTRGRVERDPAGRPVRGVGVLLDVSKRVQAEEKTRAALAELAAVYDKAPVGLCVLDTEGRYVRINARMAEMNGVPAEVHIGRSVAEIVPAVANAAEALRRQVMETGEPVLDVEIAGETPARPGVRRVWLESWLPLRDGAGRVVGINVVAEEVTERRAAEAALREGEARLRDLLATLDLTTVMARDLDGTIRFWSAGCERLYGWTAQEVVGRVAHDLLATRFPAPLPEVEAALLRDGEWRGDLRQRRRDGSEVIVATHKSLRRDADGRPVAVGESLTDVTALRRAEERQALLMREVDHRAKNALAVVQATLRLTPKDDPVAYARAVEGRVAALARAHTLLAEGRWEGAALRALIEGELAPFRPASGDATRSDTEPAPPRVEIVGLPLTLMPATAQALSMAIHELATNATKYGALSVPGGQVAVTWRLDPAAGLLRLRWAEGGGPPVSAPPSRRGFGSRVIEATVKDQLGGHIERRWAKSGLVCEMTVPIGRAVAGHKPQAPDEN